MSPAALAAIFGTSFVVSLSGALSPGPLTTLAIREGVRRGPWAGPLLALGHGALELAVVAGLALGLSQVLGHDAVAATIAALGGLFLLWLGSQIIRTAPRQELQAGDASGGVGPQSGGGSAPLAGAARVESILSLRDAGVLAFLGLAVSVANPFWVVWWATIGAAYIVEALDSGAAGVASFYSAHIIADLGWLSLIAFALSSGRRLMSQGVYQGILAACGVFLLGMGVWFLFSVRGFVT